MQVGKTTLMQSVLNQRRFAFRIDCSGAIGDATDESMFIDNLEAAVGFSPSFGAINTLFSWVETLLPMKKHALTTTKLAQLNSVLSTLDTALAIVATRFPRSSETPYTYPVIVLDSFSKFLDNVSGSGSDDQKMKSQMLLDLLIQWSIKVSNSKHKAHVVFVCDNPLIIDELNKYTECRGRISQFTVEDIEFDAACARVEAAVKAGVPLKSQRAASEESEDADKWWYFGTLSILRRVQGWRDGGQGSGSGNTNETEGSKSSEPGQLEKLWRFIPGRLPSLISGEQQPEPKEDSLRTQVEYALARIGTRIADIESLLLRVQSGKSLAEAAEEMVTERARFIRSW